MNFNPILFAFAGVFFFMWLISIVFTPTSYRDDLATAGGQTAIVTLNEEAASGLDLAVLPALIQQTQTPQALEEALNQPNGPNNLDLNGDGTVDYIKVTEFSNEASAASAKKYGFSLTTAVTAAEEQEIATIEIAENGTNADVTVSGNKQIYGQGAHYNSFFPIGTFLMMSYLLAPHRSFLSPYGWNSYPSSYGRPTVVGSDAYRNRTSSYRNANIRPSSQGTTLRSPNANKSATSIKRSLRNPTDTQRAFQARNPTRAVGSGGFGRSAGVQSRQRGFGSGLARNFSSSRRSFGGSFGK